jgi:hypothetical protein
MIADSPLSIQNEKPQTMGGIFPENRRDRNLPIFGQSLRGLPKSGSAKVGDTPCRTRQSFVYLTNRPLKKQRQQLEQLKMHLATTWSLLIGGDIPNPSVLQRTAGEKTDTPMKNSTHAVC